MARGKSTRKFGRPHSRRSRNSRGSARRTTDPVVILFVLAKALNEAEKAGMHPKLKHGIIFTDAGFVLPVRDDKWAARPLKKKLWRCVATTLTGAGEVTADAWISFPIEKTETTEDGDLLVYGKATDGSVDSDLQIVKPQFAAKAIREWYDTGANIRESHDPRRPVGKGMSIEHDGDATYVKSLVVDPVAKKLVAKGVLQAYSVGIARPTIERDVTGKARGGIIVDGTIVEISLVDRPANKSCGIQLVKSADDGMPEYVNEVFGDKDVIAKMLNGVTVAKGDMDFTPDAVPDFTFTPNDLAKIVRDKIIQQHYDDLAKQGAREEYDPFRYSTAEKRDFDPGVGGGVDRDKLDESDFAGPHRSFPIINQSDVSDALRLLHHADNPAAVRSRIASIARRKGLKMPEADGEGGKEKEALPAAQDIAVPDAVKDQNGQAGPRVAPKIPGSSTPGEPEESPCPESAEGACKSDTGKAAKPSKMKPKKGKNGKPLPPWLNKPASGDDCKLEHAHTGKCHTDPKTASGAGDAADMQPAPVGELLESPAPAHMKTEGAYLRFKTIGIDADMGILHDLTCPAFHPDEVAKFFPYADFSLIDEKMWQQKAFAAITAVGGDLTKALEAQQAWQSVAILKTADPGNLYEFRLFQYKAFRDANPGPTSYPTPGAISAQRFRRPNIAGSGHSKDSPGYGSPNSAPQVASSAPNAHSFDRPPLSAGHQSPSPSFMKGGFEYPAEQGVPTRITYAEIEKEKARRALSMMHDHLIHMFPSVCPMIDQDAYRVEQPTQVPPTTGVSKVDVPAEPAVVLGDVYKYIAKLEKQVQAGLITEEEARQKLSKKTAKKYAESLSAQVQKGLTSRDEILRALGISVPAAEKAAEPAVTKAVTQEPGPVGVPAPEVMKTMMSEILQPFQDKISAQENELAAYRQREEERDAQYKALLDEQQKNNQRWEDLANRPDPGSASFAGLALNPLRQSPAGIVKTAEVSQQIQGMMVRQLERTWRTSENPAEREAAYTALQKYKGNIE